MATLTRETANTKSEISALLYANNGVGFHEFMELAGFMLDKYAGFSAQNKKPELEAGYVKITGCEGAEGFERICKNLNFRRRGKVFLQNIPEKKGIMGLPNTYG